MRAFKIAITGGIGSGKTTVSQYVRSKGFNVYDADKIAAQIMSQADIKSKIIKTFCLHTDANGGYDKKELAHKIFNDKSQLKLLNSIVHPPTLKCIIEKMNESSGVVFAEIPLLFESHTQNLFDHVLIVMRDVKSRIDSVISRSSLTRSEVEERIKNQYNYEKKPDIEHTVIYNDSDIASLNKQLDVFLSEIRKKAY